MSPSELIKSCHPRISVLIIALNLVVAQLFLLLISSPIIHLSVQIMRAISKSSTDLANVLDFFATFISLEMLIQLASETAHKKTSFAFLLYDFSPHTDRGSFFFMK
jgi:hypothetical protein